MAPGGRPEPGSGRFTRISELGRTISFCLFALLGLFVSWKSLPLTPALQDFGSFVESGRAIAAGLNPYGVYPLTYRATYGTTVVAAPNLNPPISLIAFQLLAFVDPLLAFRGWYVASALIFVATVILLERAYPEPFPPFRAAWAFAMAGFWDTMHMGQIYAPLGLLATGAWLLLRQQRYRLAGILIGLLVAVKPNLALWPVLLFTGGFGVTTAWAVLTGIVLSTVPALTLGPRVYVEWWQAVEHDTAIAVPPNGSLAGLTAQLGAPWFGMTLAAVLVVASVVWIWQTRPPALYITALALLLSLLAAPVSWTGYTILLLPIFFERPWRKLLSIAAVLLILPVSSLGLLATLLAVIRQDRTMTVSRPLANCLESQERVITAAYER